MRPVQIPDATHNLGAPRDWDEATHGSCESLSIVAQDGVMYSYWRPTWRERFQILFGRRIRLGVVGSGHPPVAIDTED